MKLFTFATSPYARKVRIVLDYKGIAYEPLERCYSLDRKEDLAARSQRAEVPVLVLDDGRTIADSTIICEYLEQVYPDPPVYPRDAFERSPDALDRRSLRSHLRRGGLRLFSRCAAQGGARIGRRCRMRRAANALALMETLERELGDREYFCGDVQSRGFLRDQSCADGAHDEDRS